MRSDDVGLALELHSLEWSFERGAPPFLVLPRLQVRAGESVAITGPSGSGKTSLLYLLTGMERADRGTIRWDTTDLVALPEGARDAWRRSNVGMVFQDFRLVEDLSVIDNVLLPASFSRWRPGPQLLERARQLLERVGLGAPHQAVATLSRGEMQRAALARALLFAPRLIIADEPTASLDAANERAVGDLLFETARESGATMLISTHHPEVRSRADRVLALNHGRVVPS